MTSRGPILVSALAALAAALALWFAFGAGDAGGAAAGPESPGAAQAEGNEDEVALVAPLGDSEPAEATVAVATALEPEEARSAVPSAWSAPLRGRVLDRLTDDGVPKVVVQIRSTELGRKDLALTDEDGRFESPVAYETSHHELRAYDALEEGPSRLSTGSWSHEPGAGDMEWRIDVGPTFRPNVVGGPEGTDWKARLFELNQDGEQRAWTWIEIDTLDGWPGWMRYPEVEHSPEPGWRPALQVTDGSESWFGEVAVVASVGQHPHPIQVAVEAHSGTVRGTVTDTDARPVAAHVLLLFRDGDGEQPWAEAGTDEQGAFELDGVPGGAHRLMVQTDHRPVARYDVEVVPGRATVRDVVLERVEIAGDVRGALVGPPEGGEPLAFVQLEALEGGATSLVQLAGFWLFSDPDGTGRSEFAFEGLPAGRYEVRVSPMDGRRYDRLAAEVRVPAEDLLFTTDDVVQEKYAVYVLSVVDASTGELLPEISLLWRLGPMWSSEIETSSGHMIESGPPMPDLVGVVSAPGYVPRAFVARDFEPDGDLLTMELPLERGHGAAVVVLDAEHLFGGSEARFDDYLAAEGIAGARVVARGRTLGKSDASGLAMVRASQPIDAFEVRAPGWVELTRLHFQDLARSPGGAGFVLMVRE